jgi:hypothetical protein
VRFPSHIFVLVLVIDFFFTVDCRTQGGIFTTPGEAYTTPVEMWLKGLGKSHDNNIFLGTSLPRKQIHFLHHCSYFNTVT